MRTEESSRSQTEVCATEKLVSKKKQTIRNEKASSSNNKSQSPFALPMIGIVVLAFVVVILFIKRQSNGWIAENGTTQTVNSVPVTKSSPSVPSSTQPLTMEVNKAVMVTAELDFSSPLPTIAQALTEIERHYKPDDGVGRTFAILDAYGEPTPDSKLHISMHVSSEKPGIGSLVFKRTGDVLWTSKITPVPGASPVKDLRVYIADEKGTPWIVDGSIGAGSILDAKLHDKPITVRDFWPDGAEREVTLVYSACGCPVKVTARRSGERTTRTKELPVIFPDDPPAVQTIAQLMRW
jgi:hypothetical protein